MDQFIKAFDAAGALGVSKEYVYQLIRAGRLAAVDRYLEGCGRKPMKVIPIDDLLRYARQSYRPGQDDHGPGRYLSRLESTARKKAASLRAVQDDSEEEEIVSRYQAGQPYRRISADLGVSESTVKKVLGERGVKTRRTREFLAIRRREDALRLPEATRDEILRRYRAGEGLAAIAEAIGWRRSQQQRVKRLLLGLGEPLRDAPAAAKEVWRRRKGKE